MKHPTTMIQQAVRATGLLIFFLSCGPSAEEIARMTADSIRVADMLADSLAAVKTLDSLAAVKTMDSMRVVDSLAAVAEAERIANAKPSPPPPGWKEISGGFSYRDMKINSAFGITEAIGKIRNDSGLDCKSATFEMAVFDFDQELIGVSEIEISNLANGKETRAQCLFAGSLEERMAFGIKLLKKNP